MEKCRECKKKHLITIKCRCEYTLCIQCKNPDVHKCKFDYKKQNQEDIANKNKLIVASKLDEI